MISEPITPAPSEISPEDSRRESAENSLRILEAQHAQLVEELKRKTQELVDVAGKFRLHVGHSDVFAERYKELEDPERVAKDLADARISLEMYPTDNQARLNELEEFSINRAELLQAAENNLQMTREKIARNEQARADLTQSLEREN
jgi:hypothetical protein